MLQYIHRGGLFDMPRHCLLVNWAADCAEHVLPLFTTKYPEDDRPHRAIETARAWSRGEATMGEAREASFATHAAARSVSDAAAREVARAAGHELGAAAYAIKAIRLASLASGAMTAIKRECQWQREQLPEAIREIVLSDEERRNKKFYSVFTC